MKKTAILLVISGALLTACASEPAHNAPVAANSALSATASGQSSGGAATGNTFYTAPVTTPVR